MIYSFGNCRQVTKGSLSKVIKPNSRLVIGFDQLPSLILHSTLLTGNDLAQLANEEKLPEKDPSFMDDRSETIKEFVNGEKKTQMLHQYVQELFANHEVAKAWQVLLHEGEN